MRSFSTSHKRIEELRIERLRTQDGKESALEGGDVAIYYVGVT